MIQTPMQPAEDFSGKTERDPLTPIHPKIAEYISRVDAGEDVSKITEGLPEAMRNAVLEGLRLKTESEKNPNVGEQGGQKNGLIPPQYYTSEGEPLDPEILEDIWIVPIYTNPEETVLELERKQKGVEFARQYYERKSREEARESEEEKKLDEARSRLGLNKTIVENSPESYAAFKAKQGSTGDGEYWWHEYRNHAAKQLKESGKFEWGKERIYFDAPTDSFEALRDISIRVASEQKIAVAFKYRDTAKTKHAENDEDTRFVANFATAEDAAHFFKSLTSDQEYRKIVPDRKIDYKGVRLDEMAEYSSSYREQRGPLEKIMQATRRPDGSYLYKSDNGRNIRITEDEFNHFSKQWGSLQQKMETARNLFGQK